MNFGPQLLLIGAVAAVGVLHTLVPDHWLPIAVMARQRGWSRSETARVALKAGMGHVLSTLVVAAVVWIAGATIAKRFGNAVDTISSVALIGFGLWIATTAWVSQHHEHSDSHAHSHRHLHPHDGAFAQHHHDGTAQRGRTALMLILGSSPMVEGVPAFFAAGRYGAYLISAMSVVFGLSTVATYVLLCVYSSLGLRRIRVDALERHGEALSGVAIALVGLAFWLWPIR